MCGRQGIALRGHRGNGTCNLEQQEKLKAVIDFRIKFGGKFFKITCNHVEIMPRLFKKHPKMICLNACLMPLENQFWTLEQPILCNLSR